MTDNAMKKCGTKEAKDACEKICVDGRKVFDRYDTDKNGTLSRCELEKLLKDGDKTKKMDPNNVFVYCDLDQDGKITKEEFVKALVCNNIEDRIKRVFNDIDKDNSGFIDKKELGNMAGQCEKEGVDRGSLDRVLKKYDTDASGEVSFEEFKAAFFKD